MVTDAGSGESFIHRTGHGIGLAVTGDGGRRLNGTMRELQIVA